MSMLNQQSGPEGELQGKLNLLAIATVEKTVSALEKALSAKGTVAYRVSHSTASRPLRELVEKGFRSEAVDVVIVEVDGEELSEQMDDIRLFVEKFGEETDLVATFPRKNMQIMPDLLRSGVRDVLPLPLNEEDLDHCINNSLARTRKTSLQPRKGSVVCFLNTRSGAGGPFVAANLAHSLQFELEKKVALVDLDIQFGTVAYDLDIKSDGGIVEALRNHGRIDQVFVEALMAKHSSGVDVLASPADLTTWDGLSPKALERLILVLQRSYDHVVINLPVLINDVTLKALSMSNPIFLVTQGTISMMRNLNMVVHRLPVMGLGLENMEIILNRAGTEDKDLKSSDMASFFGDIPHHRVRSDFKIVTKAENEGKAACEIDSRAGLVEDIRAIAQHVAGLAGEGKIESPSKKAKRRWFF